MKFKYIASKQTNPYVNLALEECLFDCCFEDTSILYLWRNENTVVIGRNQDPYAECRVDELLNSGGYIARRNSGGGAVYHDLGNLNISVISRKGTITDTKYYRLLLKIFGFLGLNAEFNDRNDIVAEGRKVSGNAVYSNEKIVCRHGTILINSDISRMNFLLTPDSEKLIRNQVSSVASRVANLNEFLEGVTAEKVKKAIILCTEAEEMNYTNYDKIKKLTDKFSNKKWIFEGKADYKK